MGCVSAKVTRTGYCDLRVAKTGKPKVVINNVFTLITAAITFVSTTVVNITHNSQMTVNVTPKAKPIVNVGLVCTVNLADGLELWWCDGWKALWNNRKRILWRQE